MELKEVFSTKNFHQIEFGVGNLNGNKGFWGLTFMKLLGVITIAWKEIIINSFLMIEASWRKFFRWS